MKQPEYQGEGWVLHNSDCIEGMHAMPENSVDCVVTSIPFGDLFVYSDSERDLGNAGSSPFAGSITAALFLQRFIPDKTTWAHFDTFAWRPTAKPGRPKGGAALGLRAAWAMLQSRYDRRGKREAA